MTDNIFNKDPFNRNPEGDDLELEDKDFAYDDNDFSTDEDLTEPLDNDDYVEEDFPTSKDDEADAEEDSKSPEYDEGKSEDDLAEPSDDEDEAKVDDGDQADSPEDAPKISKAKLMAFANFATKKEKPIEFYERIKFDPNHPDKYAKAFMYRSDFWSKFMVPITALLAFVLLANIPDVGSFWEALAILGAVALLIVTTVLIRKNNRKMQVTILSQMMNSIAGDFDLYVFKDHLVCDYKYDEEGKHTRFIMFDEIETIIRSNGHICIGTDRMVVSIHKKQIDKRSLIHTLVSGSFYKKNVKLPAWIGRMPNNFGISIAMGVITCYSIFPLLILDAIIKAATGIPGDFNPWSAYALLPFILIPIGYAICSMLKGNKHIGIFLAAIVGILTLTLSANSATERLNEAHLHLPVVEQAEEAFEIDVPDTPYIKEVSSLIKIVEVYFDDETNEIFNNSFKNDSRILNDMELNNLYVTYFNSSYFSDDDSITKKGDIGIIYNVDQDEFNIPSEKYSDQFGGFFITEHDSFIIIIYNYEKQKLYIEIR